ncbi:MAG: GntP family permease [Marinilabiliales bacterium]|nr:GntP family permease [Marinilabiliales bacterium]
MAIPSRLLIIATLLAIWLLGIRRGMSRDRIMSLSTKALGPAGTIILVTGAGGVLKEVLVESGIGTALANSVAGTALSPVLLAWIIAALVRVTQGSATVAMITAAGIVAPILPVFGLDAPHLALIVIAISSGATIASHVNDSGFWLVSKYFGMNEKQTLPVVDSNGDHHIALRTGIHHAGKPPSGLTWITFRYRIWKKFLQGCLPG